MCVTSTPPTLTRLINLPQVCSLKFPHPEAASTLAFVGRCGRGALVLGAGVVVA